MSAATPAGGNFGVGTWIERRARITPAHLALVGDGRSLTYADLAGRIRRLANALLNLGVGPGYRVAWSGQNHPAFLESLFACGQVRAALAPANHRLGGQVVAAVVVAPASEATEEDILRFAHQHLAPHQVPVVLAFAERLPRNSVGKLVRAELRRLVVQEK